MPERPYYEAYDEREMSSDSALALSARSAKTV